jgi:hypothetical protein
MSSNPQDSAPTPEDLAFQKAWSDAAMKVRPRTKTEVLRAIPNAELEPIVQRIGADLWVVINKEGTSVVQDPALHKPFYHRNKKFAELVAHETGGVVVTWNEAVNLLTKNAALIKREQDSQNRRRRR